MTHSSNHNVGYWRLLQSNRKFRFLFFGRAISLMGDWFNTLAIFALLDGIYGHRAEYFGWVLILKLLPLFVMGPAAGVVADRLNRRWIMITSDLSRVVVVLAFLFLARWPDLRLLVGLTFLQTSLSAFFEPARTAALAQICNERELISANALLAVTWSIMLTLGASVGGLASHFFGWQMAIILDAATYLVSAALLIPVRVGNPNSAPRERHWQDVLGWRDAWAGFDYMRRNGGVATMVLAKGAWGVGGAITLLLTLFGQRVYAINDSPVLGMTLFYASRGLGTALGPILSRKVTGDRPAAMHAAIFGSFLLAAVFYCWLGLTHSLILSLLLVIIAHIGGATIWVFSTVLIQRFVPHGLQGRVFAAEMALFTATFSISTYVYGYLLDNQGITLHVLTRWLGLCLLFAGTCWFVAARKWPLIRLASSEKEI